MKIKKITECMVLMLSFSLIILFFSCDAGINSNLSHPVPLDKTFGGTGIVRVDFFGHADEARSIHIQADGKLLLSGFTTCPGKDQFGNTVNQEDFAAARLNPDGTPDMGFGSSGRVNTDVARLGYSLAFSNSDWGYCSVMLPDEGLIITGASHTADDVFQNSSILKYNSSGNPDPAFDSDGIFSNDFIDARHEELYAAGFLSDGSIVAAGCSSVSGYDPCSDFFITRVGSSGSLFPGFGTNGYVEYDFNTKDDRAFALAVQADDTIIVAGTNGQDFAAVKLNSDGIVDSDYGHGGRVLTDSGSGYDSANAAVLQADGKLILAGTDSSDFVLARYNTDGTPDSNFGRNGIVITDMGGKSDTAYSVAVNADGKIYAAGTTGLDFALSCYNPDGSLDSDFAGDGKIVTDLGRKKEILFSVVLKEEGTIVAAGTDGNDFIVIRYKR